MKTNWSSAFAYGLLMALCASGAALSGCGALVDPESLVIKCEIAIGMQAEDPCAGAGMHCVEGVCTACQGERENCNGIDDDCDGRIDEGHDQDGDGFTWCGGGLPELVDCDPTDPSIHPSIGELDENATLFAVEELCDGKDNDCDTIIDEAPLCEQQGSCVDFGCSNGLRCDGSTGRCVAPRPVGSGCTGDAECEGGFCVTPAMYEGLGSTATSARCASACCTDADCGQGAVCVATSRGLRMCLPTEIVGRGENLTGRSCRESSDCASGLCVSGDCRERCTNEAMCGGAACVLAPVGTGRVWTCDETVRPGVAGDLCTEFDPTVSMCKSLLCMDSQCKATCGRDSDCTAGQRCAYQDVVKLFPPLAIRTAYCQSAGSATDTPCCTSADCGPGSLCKAKAADESWDMVCAP